MWNQLKAIKLWQVGVLAVVLIGAAAGVYFGFNVTRPSEGAGLTKDQQAVPAQVGNLVNQVSVSGSLTYPNTETLTFGTAGAVDKVLVDEGQSVKTGQSLAQLDASTMASLEKAIAQAQVNVNNAQAELDAAKTPYTATAIAQADANVTAKQLAVQTAQTALDDAKNPYTATAIAQVEADVVAKQLAVQTAQTALDDAKNPYSASDISQADASVTAKQQALQTAQQNLDNLLKPTEQALAQARSAVSSAQVSLQNAQQALETAKATSAADTITDAQAAVDSAKASLENARADLATARSQTETNVSNAQKTHDTAATNYENAFAKYLGIGLTDEQAKQEPEALLASWRIDLSTLFLRTGVTQTYIPGDDPATPWNETVVFAWTNLRPGGVYGTCDGITLPTNAVCVASDLETAWTPVQPAADALASAKNQAAKTLAASQKAVDQAQDALASAQQALAALKAGPDPVSAQIAVVKAKEDQVNVAQANLKVAQDNLDKLLKPDTLTVESLRKQVTVTQAQLADAQQHLADVKAGADSLVVASKSKQLEVSKAQLVDAQERLAEVKAGADPLEVASKSKQRELAKAQLADAQESLAEMKAGADAATVALKTAAVNSAKLALQTAQELLADATLTAPFDGVVTKVSATDGQSIGPATAILTLTDTSVVEVSGNVDEVDILYVKVGATATVTLDALRGQTLQGAVSSISTAATTQSGVVRYPVSIRVTVPAGVELRAGLTATANVVLRQENNVLLIPSLAVRGSYSEPYVLVANGGKAKQQAVSLGNSDDYWVVVTSGLNEGDRVVMDASTTTAQSNINAALRQFQLGGVGVPAGGVFISGGQEPGRQQQQSSGGQRRQSTGGQGQQSGR